MNTCKVQVEESILSELIYVKMTRTASIRCCPLIISLVFLISALTVSLDKNSLNFAKGELFSGNGWCII